MNQITFQLYSATNIGIQFSLISLHHCSAFFDVSRASRCSWGMSPAYADCQVSTWTLAIQRASSSCACRIIISFIWVDYSENLENSKTPLKIEGSFWIIFAKITSNYIIHPPLPTEAEVLSSNFLFMRNPFHIVRLWWSIHLEWRLTNIRSVKRSRERYSNR